MQKKFLSLRKSFYVNYGNMKANDKQFMRQAITYAFDGMNADAGGPFGAVIVKKQTYSRCA